MASSSRIHGLHQVAQKLITIGFPSFVKVEVFTVSPCGLVTAIFGSEFWPYAKAVKRNANAKISFFMSCNFNFYIK